MTVVRAYWLPIVLLLLAFVTIALLIWPQGEAAAPAPGAARYTGPVFSAREAAAPRNFSILVGGDQSDEAEPVAAQALPVLTGIAGGSAYLRSTATGEVQRLTRGESLDGWRLLSVRSREVVLGNGETEQRLSLFAPASPATPTGQPAGPVTAPPQPLPTPSGP